MTFSVDRRIEFRDTDAAGIVHFSAFFPMMEAAEHEMLRSLGIAIMPKVEAGVPPLSWPRIAAECRYVAAARFEDILRISVEVAHVGNTSVQYRCRFTREDQLIAEGTLTVVCCRMTNLVSPEDESRGMEKTTIPEPIRKLLAKHQ